METISKEIIYDIFGILNKNYLKTNLDTIKDIKDINEKLSLFNSFSLGNIINELTDIIVEGDFDENKKCEFLILLSEIDNIKNKSVNYDIILIKILSKYLTLKN